MDISHFTPGTYRLKIDVKHPHPDRRYKHDWRKFTTVFKAGTEFFIKEKGFGGTKYLVLELKNNRWSHQDIAFHWATTRRDDIPEAKLMRALLPHLERISDAVEIETKEMRRERVCLAIVLILKRAIERGYFDDKPGDLPDELAEKAYAREHIDNYVKEFMA